MLSLAAQMPLMSRPKRVSQAATMLVALVEIPIGVLEVQQLDLTVGGQRLLQAGLALDRRHVRGDAAQSDDAALAAERVEQRLGRLLAGGNAAERKMRDVVVAEVPRMQVVGLVPHGHHAALRRRDRLDDRPRIRTIVRVDAENGLVGDFGEQRLNVGQALFAVSLSHQRLIVLADARRKGFRTFVPRSVEGVGQRSDRAGEAIAARRGGRPLAARGREGADAQ